MFGHLSTPKYSRQCISDNVVFFKSTNTIYFVSTSVCLLGGICHGMHMGSEVKAVRRIELRPSDIVAGTFTH